MRQDLNRVESAPLSVSTLGSLSDNASHDWSTDDESLGVRHRNDISRDENSRDGNSRDGNSRDGNRRNRRRKGNKSRRDRRGTDVIKAMTPLVKVLLAGVLLSFLDVLYILNHLESSDMQSVDPLLVRQSKFRSEESANEINKKTDDSNETELKIKTKADVDKPSKTKADVDKLLEDRAPIIKLIKDAGINFDPDEDTELIQDLPTWADVVNMYGPEPVIYGLNEGNCERFRAQTDKHDHFIGTAGTFNSGTNLMSELLIANCMLPDHMEKYGYKSRGIRWQVPWGKHSPVGDREWRIGHKTIKDMNVSAEEIMPMVTIRDPLIWLKSMCRHKYTSRWAGYHIEPPYRISDHCPDFLLKSLKMSVRYDGFNRTHDSLVHFYNDWYDEYINVEIPFLLVRFEDLVFHPEETITKVCECGGGKRTSKKFHYVVNSAKKGLAAHGAMHLRTGFVDALVKYGNLKKRYKDWNSKSDLEYVKDHISQSLMEKMNYKSIDPSWGAKE